MIPTDTFAAFLFDMDGTVTDSIAATERVWTAWAQRHGLEVDAFLPTIHGVRAEETIRRQNLAGIDIAEDSGARVVQAQGDAGARLAAGCAVVKSAWILALGEDLALPEGWRTPVEAHLAGGGGKPAWIAAPGLLGLPGRPLAVLASREAVEAAGGFRPVGSPLKALLGRLKSGAVRLRA